MLGSDGAAEFEFIGCIRAGDFEQPTLYWLQASRKARVFPGSYGTSSQEAHHVIICYTLHSAFQMRSPRRLARSKCSFHISPILTNAIVYKSK